MDAFIGIQYAPPVFLSYAVTGNESPIRSGTPASSVTRIDTPVAVLPARRGSTPEPSATAPTA